MGTRPGVVLVHGAGGTPATWSAVLPILRARGIPVVAVTNPMASLEGDVAHTCEVIEQVIEDGIEEVIEEGARPLVLVGHSYGGAVITNAGRHPRVGALVYVAAFAPQEGETVQEIVERYEPAPVSAHMVRGPHGEWKSSRTPAYWAEIGWDLTPAQRADSAFENRPADKAIFEQPSGRPAWLDLPSWYLVADGDATLLPSIQRDMAARLGAVTSSVPGSHFVPLVSPHAVVDLVEQALSAVGDAAVGDAAVGDSGARDE